MKNWAPNNTDVLGTAIQNLCQRLYTNKPTLADILVKEAFALRSEVARSALITVGTLCVISTVLTHTASLVVTVNIDRQAQPVHLLVVYTLVRMSKTLTSCANK